MFVLLCLQAVGEDEDDEHAPFMRKPFCVYRGHTADLLDLSWSKVRFGPKFRVDLCLYHTQGVQQQCSAGKVGGGGVLLS